MADVFRATAIQDDRQVAIKVLRSPEPGGVRRFRSEASVLSRLDHPGVIRLRETGAHEGVLYLVLDLAEGRSLAEVLRDGPIGVDRTVAISEQLADALAHAHGLGVVHRDVKPSNILSADADRVCLGDFGIARLLGSISLTCTGQLIGSGPYLAPEQVTGEAVGPAADMYSLALVMIECIAGHRCYGGGPVEAAVARLHRPPRIPPDLPDWLRRVLSTMTAADPTRRPSAASVAEALRVQSVAPVLAPTVPLGLSAPAGRPGGGPVTAAHVEAARNPAGVGAVLAAVLALLVVATTWMTGGAGSRPDRPLADSTSAPTVIPTTAMPTTTVAPVVTANTPPSSSDGDPPASDGRETANGRGTGNGHAHAERSGEGQALATVTLSASQRRARTGIGGTPRTPLGPHARPVGELARVVRPSAGQRRRRVRGAVGHPRERLAQGTGSCSSPSGAGSTRRPATTTTTSSSPQCPLEPAPTLRRTDGADVPRRGAGMTSEWRGSTRRGGRRASHERHEGVWHMERGSGRRS